MRSLSLGLPFLAILPFALPAPAAEETLFQAEPFTESVFTGGIEGPAVDEDGWIYCVKFGAENTIGRTSPDGDAELFVTLPEGSTANGIRLGIDGRLLVADYTGHNILQIDRNSREIRVLAHHAEMSQPNDLAITAHGVLYASDPDWKSGTGRIWLIDRAGRVRLVADQMGTTNGIDLSPDGGTLYVNESMQRRVWSFTVEPDGSLSGKTLVREFPDHGFDGMRVDVEGNLYITRHGKGTVVKMTPAGEILQEIELPGAKPSNLCFGGPDGRTVYVTEMEHRRLVRFRADQPGLEWRQLQERLAAGLEPRPADLKLSLAVPEVCAWPNLTLMPDGSVVAVLFNQPAHGTQEGDIECWASTDGLEWEKRGVITRHDPGTVRMNHAAGLAANGDLIVLCSGWTDHPQPPRPKQAPFRDAIVPAITLRSADGGRTWTQHDRFPAAEPGWSPHIPFGDIWTGADGALHTSTYQGSMPEPEKSSRLKTWRAWHFRSTDDGANWEPAGLISPTHNETQIFPLGGPRWLAAARTTSMDIFQTTDNGANWSLLSQPTERNEINGHLCRLADGRLLLTYGVRVAGRQGVCAKLSNDEGATWSPALRLAESFSSDCGYPSSVQLPSGDIVTAFYALGTPEYPGYQMSTAVWRP